MEYVGILRNEQGLKTFISYLSKLKRQRNLTSLKYIKDSNMYQISRIVATSALAREESRGCHFREDYPRERKSYKYHLTIRPISDYSM